MVTLMHSLVCTARFWMSFGCGKPWDHQEAVLPPQCIIGTDNITVCKALLLGLENRVFGCPIREWFTKRFTNMRCSDLQLLLFMVSADYACANLVVLHLLWALALV